MHRQRGVFAALPAAHAPAPFHPAPSYAINGDIVEDEDGHVSIRRKNYGSMPDFFNMPDMASLTSEDKWALIESLVFVVFTLLFAFVVVNGNDFRSFSMTQRVRDMFIGAELYMSDGFPFAKYYPDIVTIEDWWGWMEGPAIDALYQEDWYNGNPLPPAMLNKVLLFNQRIGKARLRQVQGKEMPCEVPADQKNFKMCDLPFIAEYESTSAFGPKDDAKKYTWDSAANNGGARSSSLKTATYPGGGYVLDCAAATAQQKNKKHGDDSSNRSLTVHPSNSPPPPPPPPPPTTNVQTSTSASGPTCRTTRRRPAH